MPGEHSSTALSPEISVEQARHSSSSEMLPPRSPSPDVELSRDLSPEMSPEVSPDPSPEPSLPEPLTSSSVAHVAPPIVSGPGSGSVSASDNIFRVCALQSDSSIIQQHTLADFMTITSPVTKDQETSSSYSLATPHFVGSSSRTTTTLSTSAHEMTFNYRHEEYQTTRPVQYSAEEEAEEGQQDYNDEDDEDDGDDNEEEGEEAEDDDEDQETGCNYANKAKRPRTANNNNDNDEDDGGGGGLDRDPYIMIQDTAVMGHSDGQPRLPPQE